MELIPYEGANHSSNSMQGSQLQSYVRKIILILLLCNGANISKYPSVPQFFDRNHTKQISKKMDTYIFFTYTFAVMASKN